MYTNNYANADSLLGCSAIMGNYLRPTGLGDALTALDGAVYTIVAGGTDFYPARVGKPLDDDVLDVTALDDLRGIEKRDGGYHIGALVTWTDLIRADLPAWFDGLKMAAREVGGVQIQNAGTIVGNICNASPAADGMPSLLAMDAVVHLASAGESRAVPLAEFVTGNRRTERRGNELVTGVTVPIPAHPARSTFMKLGARKYLVISISMIGAVLETADDGTVAAARIAVGACSEVARRLPALETALKGKPATSALGDTVSTEHLSPLSPIEDVRGTAEYRLDAAATLVRRVLNELGGKA